MGWRGFGPRTAACLVAATVCGLTATAPPAAQAVQSAPAAVAAAAPPAAATLPRAAVPPGLPARSVWLAEVARIADQATGYLEQRVAARRPGEALAVVLDIDNTSLQTTYTGSRVAPAVPSVVAFAKRARSLGVSVFFITARPKLIESLSRTNLLLVGYPVDGLYTRDTLSWVLNKTPAAIEAYKTTTRKNLQAFGWTIVANVGNSTTDLTGGYSERTFKLPDYAGLLD